MGVFSPLGGQGSLYQERLIDMGYEYMLNGWGRGGLWGVKPFHHVSRFNQVKNI